MLRLSASTLRNTMVTLSKKRSGSSFLNSGRRGPSIRGRASYLTFRTTGTTRSKVHFFSVRVLFGVYPPPLPARLNGHARRTHRSGTAPDSEPLRRQRTPDSPPRSASPSAAGAPATRRGRGSGGSRGGRGGGRLAGVMHFTLRVSGTVVRPCDRPPVNNKRTE